MLHSPSNAPYIGENYGRSTIASLCGFMTYRYLYMCCKGADKLNNSDYIADLNDLSEHHKNNCYIDYFVRQESLEESLIEGLSKIIKLTDEQKNIIYQDRKTNASSRPLSINDYYDQTSIDLVAKRDALVIDKFDYKFPSFQ